MSTVLAAFWIGCGVLHHGLWFAHFQRTYPNMGAKWYWADMAISIAMSLLGPLALVGLAVHVATFKPEYEPDKPWLRGVKFW